MDYISVRPLLRISKLHINFFYLPHPDFKSKDSHDLVLENALSEEDVEFLVRTDDLAPNFKMKFKHSSDLTLTEVAVVGYLQPKEAASLEFTYIPQKTGRTVVQLPLYVRGYSDGSVYNYIVLEGNYPAVEFETDEPEIHMEPIPCGQEFKKKIYIKVKNHCTRCLFKLSSDVSSVHFSYPRGREIPADYHTVDLFAILEFSSDEPVTFFTKILITCDCGGS